MHKRLGRCCVVLCCVVEMDGWVDLWKWANEGGSDDTVYQCFLGFRHVLYPTNMYYIIGQIFLLVVSNNILEPFSP
jgi:hypothetical protein